MRAIEIFIEHYSGNQSAAARAIGKKQAHIWYWLNKAPDMPAEFVPKAALAIEKKPSDLMPDIFDEPKKQDIA